MNNIGENNLAALAGGCDMMDSRFLKRSVAPTKPGTTKSLISCGVKRHIQNITSSRDQRTPIGDGKRASASGKPKTATISQKTLRHPRPVGASQGKVKSGLIQFGNSRPGQFQVLPLLTEIRDNFDRYTVASFFTSSYVLGGSVPAHPSRMPVALYLGVR